VDIVEFYTCPFFGQLFLRACRYVSTDQCKVLSF
jgi:hypothetical protein